MKTKTFETRTDSVTATEEWNPTETLSRFTDMEVLKLVQPSSREEMTSPKPAVVPDGPELWRLYHQQADSHIENALIESYLPLVHFTLNRLAGTLPNNIDRDDLHSAGVLGLLAALRKFNPATGVPFNSYARLRSPQEPVLPMKQRGGKKRTSQTHGDIGQFDLKNNPATSRRAA